MKIAMIGAGSQFTLNMVEAMRHEVFANSEFVLMDLNAEKLEQARCAAARLAAKQVVAPRIFTTTSLEQALEGARYVIVSSEQNRYPNWLLDVEIPRRHGVHQLTAENGGPGGLIHGLRNIRMLSSIVEAVERICPDAWLLNYTNPMSILCEWLDKYTNLRYAGFCHQVHGSFGVIAEQLGLEPGELEPISAGINHLNWLFDVRRGGKSWMEEFNRRVQESKWWREHLPGVPRQDFSLEIFKTFGMYPIGYDDHIAEYLSCFYEAQEWTGLGITSIAENRLKPHLETKRDGTFKAQHLIGNGSSVTPPFPKDVTHPYYRETAPALIAALETGEPAYFDAMVGRNNGAVSNLPPESIIDRPVVAAGGEIRSVHVGSLPPGPREVCRRQIAIHELIVEAASEGDENLVLQALCLDPYVRSITQAKAIWRDFQEEYADSLPRGFRKEPKSKPTPYASAYNEL